MAEAEVGIRGVAVSAASSTIASPAATASGGTVDLEAEASGIACGTGMGVPVGGLNGPIESNEDSHALPGA